MTRGVAWLSFPSFGFGRVSDGGCSLPAVVAVGMAWRRQLWLVSPCAEQIRWPDVSISRRSFVTVLLEN